MLGGMLAAREGQSHPSVPPVVAAAQDYLRFAEGLRNPPPGFDGMRGMEPRELNKKEQAVYDSALEVLRNYFSGESNYSPSEAGPAVGGNDGPQERVPVSQ